jgi:hypothetical protein
MEFRWLAILAVWTVLSGPVFGPPAGGAARPKQRPAAKTSAQRAPAIKTIGDGSQSRSYANHR